MNGINIEVRITSEEIELKKNEANVLLEEALKLLSVSSGKELTIETPQQYQVSAEILMRIKGKLKDIEETRKEKTIPLDQKKKEIMECFKPALDTCVEAENILKKAMLVFNAKQEEIRIKEEKKMRELIEKEEGKKRAQLEAKATKLEANGNLEKAQEIKEEAATLFIPKPIILSAVEPIKGITTKDKWTFEIIDINQVPREYLIVDEKKLSGIAKSLRNTFPIAGIKFYAEQIIASASKR